MNEQLFLQTVNSKAKEFGISPLLLLSGIEGIYSFREVKINAINYQFLDSLILSIFTLRIGDGFHSIAEENLKSSHESVRIAAKKELSELSAETISQSPNIFLKSFAGVLNGSNVIRKYHEKALEVAALEVKKMQLHFSNESIGAIMIEVCKTDLNEALNMGGWFNA